jgi:hypothetical protein
VAALALADATPLQGGIPIIIDGAVVGAVGVSGDTPKVDEDIAIAGAAAVAPRAPAPGPATAEAAPAPDPVGMYPDNYRVLLNNDQVRIVDFRLARGAVEQSHAHPAHVAVFLSKFRIRFTLPGSCPSRASTAATPTGRSRRW